MDSFIAPARKSLELLERVSGCSGFGDADDNAVVAMMAHTAAVYAMIAAQAEPECFRLYADAHRILSDRMQTEEGRRESLYRAVWGCALYTQHFPESNDAWKNMSDMLALATVVALPKHESEIASFMEIVETASASGITVEDFAHYLTEKSDLVVTREMVIEGLKPYLARKLRSFNTGKPLVFTPLEESNDGDGNFMTMLTITDSDDCPQQYGLAIRAQSIRKWNKASGGMEDAVVVIVQGAKFKNVQRARSLGFKGGATSPNLVGSGILTSDGWESGQ